VGISTFDRGSIESATTLVTVIAWIGLRLCPSEASATRTTWGPSLHPGSLLVAKAVNHRTDQTPRNYTETSTDPRPRRGERDSQLGEPIRVPTSDDLRLDTMIIDAGT